jgi:hypothetical protein
MGMLYAWATPEYLLWHMTIGQVIMLHNYAVEIRSPDTESDTGTTLKSADAVRAKREELRKLYGDIDGDVR